MKRIFGIIALVMLAAAFAGRPALAGREAHIYFRNNTDAWVWVTAYSHGVYTTYPSPMVFPGGPAGAWCVGPHQYDQHGLRISIYEVRAEVSEKGCQRHPVLLNELRGFHMDKNTDIGRMTYYIHFQNGRYVYNNTP